MALRTLNFDVVSRIGEKRLPCLCGKVRKRTKRFYQTLNPFNKNPDGSVKSRQDIHRDLDKLVEAWRREPIRCEKCPAPSGQGGR